MQFTVRYPDSLEEQCDTRAWHAGCDAAATTLAATFLDEAVRFDNRVYGLQVHRDEYCRAIERQAGRRGFYDDPPEPRSVRTWR